VPRWRGASAVSANAVAHVVHQLKERGDPWLLGEEAKPAPAADYISLRKRMTSTLFCARPAKTGVGVRCKLGLPVWALTSCPKNRSLATSRPTRRRTARRMPNVA
jgi:hypothetical protein